MSLDAFLSALPDALIVRDLDLLETYCNNIRSVRYGTAAAVLRPYTLDDVVQIVKAANQYQVVLVPHGGNTSYWGGSNPREGQHDVVVSLEHMRQVREVDEHNLSMTVEAGVTLAEVHAVAAEHGLLFPLMIGSWQSCRIGGNIGTNAGGVNVLRYGMTRDLILGLEVVLPDGSVLNLLEPLRKDNTGFDVRQLFIGTEGTLGIITAASLKLALQPAQRVTAFISMASIDEVAPLLSTLRRACGEMLTSFEYLSGHSLELLRTQRPDVRQPLQGPVEHAVLMEASCASPLLALSEALESVLNEALDQGEVLDAVMATSEAQRAEFWTVRETMPVGEMLPEIKKQVVKHDISVRSSRIAEFLKRANQRVHELDPAIRFSIFGHVGDGNLHYDLVPPEGADPDYADWLRETVSPEVYAIVCALNGSISAEHGIGVDKLPLLERYGQTEKLALQRKVLDAVDPEGRFNAGKLVPLG